MDYEHLLRSYKEFPKVATSHVVSSLWRDDGIGRDKTLEIYKEWDKVKRDNNVTSNFILGFIHCWNIFKYYVKKLIGSH